MLDRVHGRSSTLQGRIPGEEHDQACKSNNHVHHRSLDSECSLLWPERHQTLHTSEMDEDDSIEEDTHDNSIKITTIHQYHDSSRLLRSRVKHSQSMHCKTRPRKANARREGNYLETVLNGGQLIDNDDLHPI
jgi:hypothetical protein